MDERFWNKVRVTPGCWLWIGAVSSRGYGGFKVGRRDERAHRVSYQMHFGPIPDGLFVLHRCDTPLCVNPDHLFVGTHADNMRDMTQKGRAARGQANGAHLYPERMPRGEHHRNSKLTLDAVVAIRSAHAAGLSPRSLALRHGVSSVQIRNIVNRRQWSDAP